MGPQPTSPRKAPVWPQHLPAAPRPALQAPRPALGFVPWDPPAGPGRPEGLSGTKAYNRDPLSMVSADLGQGVCT